MSFVEEGFLSPEMAQIQDNIISKYSDLFDLSKEVNKFAHQRKYDFVIYNQDVQAMIAGCAFIKLHNNFQAIYILCSYGLIVDAKVILRSMLELTFILKICCEDKSFVEEYVLADHIYRRKLINVSKQNNYSVFDDERRTVMEEALSELQKEIDNNKVEELQIQRLAEKAGLKEYYDTAYRLLSNPVHSGVRSLEQYLMCDEQGECKGLNFGPTDSDIGLVLITAIDNVCRGLDSFLRFLNIDKAKELKYFRDRAVELRQDGAE